MYELDLPTNMPSFHHLFHVPMHKKCVRDHSLVFPSVGGIDSLLYEEVPKVILDKKVQKLQSIKISSVKGL